jgi:hypothetical protein
MIGEVTWHSLKKAGTITHYDIRFGKKILRGIPAGLVESVNEVQHEHKER